MYSCHEKSRPVVTHPAVRDLFQTLSRHPAFQELLSKLLRRELGKSSLAGLTPTAKALYLVLLWQATERPLLVIADGNQRAGAPGRTDRNVLRSAGLAFGRIARNCCPRSMFCPARNCRRTPKSPEQRAIGLWRMASRNSSDHHRARRLGAVAHSCRRVLPAARARTAHRRRTAARRHRSAPALDRL